MSDETPASKAAARQAKLLAKSQERLAKITGAAKGEGRIASDTAVGISSTPKAPTNATVIRNPPPPTTLSLDDDPAEVDLAVQHPTIRTTRSQTVAQQQQAQLEAMGLAGAGGGGMEGLFSGMGGMGGGAPGAGGDMFSQMMASMAAGGGAGGAEGGLPAGGFPGMTMPTSTTLPSTPKTLIDRVFPLVHLLAMVGLAVYAIFWLEPARKFGEYGWMGVGGQVNWNSWAELSGKRRAGSVVAKMVGRGLAEVPLFWMFITVELGLQTTRLFLVRNRPPPPGMLNTILPILSQFSPQLALVLSTGMKYISLLSIILNDLAVLVFCIGCAVVFGRYYAGNQDGLVHILGDVVEAGWEAVKDEL